MTTEQRRENLGENHAEFRERVEELVAEFMPFAAADEVFDITGGMTEIADRFETKAAPMSREAWQEAHGG